MKTIKISDYTHSVLKKYCKENSLKLNDWVDKFLLNNMEKIDEEKIKVEKDMPKMQ